MPHPLPQTRAEQEVNPILAGVREFLLEQGIPNNYRRPDTLWASGRNGTTIDLTISPDLTPHPDHHTLTVTTGTHTLPIDLRHPHSLDQLLAILEQP